MVVNYNLVLRLSHILLGLPGSDFVAIPVQITWIQGYLEQEICLRTCLSLATDNFFLKGGGGRLNFFQNTVVCG